MRQQRVEKGGCENQGFWDVKERIRPRESAVVENGIVKDEVLGGLGLNIQSGIGCVDASSDMNWLPG